MVPAGRAGWVVLLRCGGRAGEDQGGLPADAGCFSGTSSPWASLAPGPDREGSCTAASSAPGRISVPDRGPRASRHLVRCRGWRRALVMREPQGIVDEEHEQVIERVAAIDVAKASGMVCVRVPHESKPGRRVSRGWGGAATTRAAVPELGDHLFCEGIEKVTVESTSDYWRIWYYLLEAAGLDVQLVTARQARNLPGRPKTDKLDSVWQAKCTERGMLRPSFVPPAEIRELRD